MSHLRVRWGGNGGEQLGLTNGITRFIDNKLQIF